MPAIPSATEEVRDFGLGTTVPAVMTPVVYGVSSLGTQNVFKLYSSPQTLRDERGEGPAVELAVNMLENGGGPIGFVSADPSIAAANGEVVPEFVTPGTNGAITRAGGTDGPAISVAGGPYVNASMQVKITTGGILGTGKFDWSRDGGATWEQTAITLAATVLLPGTNITVTFPAGTYVLDETYSWTATAGGGLVSVSGDSALDAHLRIRIKSDGENGEATFQYCCDGYDGDSDSERTWSEVLIIPSGGTFAVPGLGITLTFDDTVEFNEGDEYTVDVECAAWNATDLAAGFNAIKLTTTRWRFVVPVTSNANGDAAAHAVLAAALQAQLNSLAATSKYRRGMIPADQGDEPEDVLAAFANVTATRCLIAYGKVRRATTKTFPGFAFPVTHGIDVIAARAAASLPSTDLKRVKSGALDGVVKIFRDERNAPTGLDDIKISTLCTHDFAEGYYVCQGRLKSPSGSDFKLWPLGLVMDITCETAHEVSTLSIGRGIRWNSDGTIDNRDAIVIEEEIGQKVVAQVLSPTNAEGFQGYVQDVRVRMRRDNNVQATGIILYEVGIKPLGYVDYIRGVIGFVVDTAALAA